MKFNKSNIIFFVLYLAYTSIYIARVNLSMAGPELISGNIFDSAQLGILGSCFFVCYAGGRIVNGMLSDTVKPKYMLAAGLLAVGAANILISAFPPFWGMAALWIVNALAQSMLWSSVLSVIISVYDKNSAKSKSSAMVTSVAMGNILGIIVNTFLITKFGVRCAFLVPGILSAALGIMTYIATRNVKISAQRGEKHTPAFKLLKNREFLLMNAAAMIHGVMKENIGLWMAVYVADAYKVDLEAASYYILLIPTVGFIGRILYPALFKLCGENENRVSLIGFAVSAAAAVLCIWKTSAIISVTALSIIYMAVSLINTSMLSIYPIKYAKTGNTASVSGIMDFSTYLGAGISSAVYGVIIDLFGYTAMFASWAVISIAAFCIIIGLNKKRVR